MNNLSRSIIPKLGRLAFRPMSSQVGDLGSGAGKGGGGGGSIREAGGSMGKREAAQEEEYFYRKQKEQLAKLKDNLTDDIAFHKEQIKRHEEAINSIQQRVDDLQKKPMSYQVGSVGGSMRKREAAHEEEYFYRKQKEQLSKLKGNLIDDITFHKEQIKRHQEEINAIQQRSDDLHKK